MSLAKAIQSLQQLGHSTIVNVAYVTEPDHRKTGNPYYDSETKLWKIEKVGVMNGLVGVDYQNSVNNQLGREDKPKDFLSGPIWHGKGEHVDKFLVRHIDKGTLYLKVLPSGTAKVQYRFVSTKEPLNESELQLLEVFAQKKSVPDQGTDKPVFWNLIQLNNLIQMTFNHQTFEMGQ